MLNYIELEPKEKLVNGDTWQKVEIRAGLHRGHQGARIDGISAHVQTTKIQCLDCDGKPTVWRAPSI